MTYITDADTEEWFRKHPRTPEVDWVIERVNAANKRAADNAHGWSRERATSQRLQFALDEANTRIAQLEQRERDLQTAVQLNEGLLRQSFRCITPLTEGDLVQYVGVHAVEWNDRGTPTHGFVEWSEGTDNA